jgi:hypothetical protein
MLIHRANRCNAFRSRGRGDRFGATAATFDASKFSSFALFRSQDRRFDGRSQFSGLYFSFTQLSFAGLNPFSQAFQVIFEFRTFFSHIPRNLLVDFHWPVNSFGLKRF